MGINYFCASFHYFILYYCMCVYVYMMYVVCWHRTRMWSSFLSLEVGSGLKPRLPGLFAKSLFTLTFILLSWKECEISEFLLFSVFFLITCFISEFPTWILLLAMEMLLKYCLHSFLWNKKNRVILFPVLNKLSSKWVSSHLNEILLLWEIVSRDSAEDYMDLEGNDSITFSDRESGDRTT